MNQIVEDCHDHAQDDPGEVPFWRRAPITVAQLYLIKRQLAEALAEIERLKANQTNTLELGK